LDIAVNSVEQLMGECDLDGGPNIVGEFEQRDERGVEKLAHLLRDDASS